MHTQFQFTINITAAWLTIFSAIIGDVDEAIFAVIHLLWLNLLMDILAAAALATDPPTPGILKRQPEPRNAHIVSPTMWKMIIGQAIYQLAVIFSLHYVGKEYFSPPGGTAYRHQAFVFNTYIFLQVFNQWKYGYCFLFPDALLLSLSVLLTYHSCRRSDNNLNIFVGVHRNPWFLLVQTITVAGQIIIVFKGGDAFKTEPLTGVQWVWSILFGFLTLPIGAGIRMIPDSFLVSAAKRFSPVSAFLSRVQCFGRKKKDKKELEERRGSDDVFFEDLGNDEERLVRRFQWRWWRRESNVGEKKHGVAIAMAGAGLNLGGQNVVAVIENGALKSGTGLSDSTQGRAGDEAELFRWIETARDAPEEAPYGLEVHPATGKEDPVIRQTVST